MKKKRTPKQIAALVTVILFVVLLAALMCAALFGSSGLFQAVLVCVIAVPLLGWIYIWLYGLIRKRHTIASFDVASGIERSLDEAEKNQNTEENAPPKTGERHDNDDESPSGGACEPR